MNTMQKLIAQADESRTPGAMYSMAKTETPIGVVICYRDYSVYRAGMPHSTRTNWKLNGKVISSNNLVKALIQG